MNGVFRGLLAALLLVVTTAAVAAGSGDDLGALRREAVRSPRTLFGQGVQAYKDGDHQAAIRRFQALSGHHDAAAIEYDLANAYYAVGDVGRAVLHWHRSLELDPRGEDILHNLEVVTGVPVRGEGLSGFASGWFLGFTVEALERATLSLLALAVLAFAGFRLGRLRPLIWVTGGLLAMTVLVGSWAYVRVSHLAMGARGVVLGARPITATAGPGAQAEYPRVFDAHPGQVVRLHRLSGKYVQVSLPTGAAGWVERNRVEKI